MCGIVGYIGPQDATPIVLDGLRRLEYRGYDSAGIAALADGKVQVLNNQRFPIITFLHTVEDDKVLGVLTHSAMTPRSVVVLLFDTANTIGPRISTPIRVQIPPSATGFGENATFYARIFRHAASSP